MTTYRITNMDDPNESKDYPDIIAGLRPVSLLPVPYISQLEEGATQHKNDCGAACGVMLLKAYHNNLTISIDDFYDRCNPGQDEYLSATQIKNSLAFYNLQKNGEACLYPIDIFLESWGRCWEQSNPNNAALIPNYSVFFTQKPQPEALYRVRVTANILNIRSGPSANFLDTGDLKKGDEASIYKEQNKWGEIGPDRWISLVYTEKI